MDSYISKDIVPGPDGKPRFIGRDTPQPDVVKNVDRGAQMQCPICNGMFDYLVGEDTPDGGKRGCESCWRPSPKGETYVPDTEEAII